MSDCIFCKIATGEIPSFKIYEDDKVVVVLDIFPATKGHALIIPKSHYVNVYDIPDDLFSHMATVAKKIAIAAKKAFNADGVNILMNNEKAAGQVIMHAHMHVIPRYTDDNIRFKLNQKKATDDLLKEVSERYKESLKL